MSSDAQRIVIGGGSKCGKTTLAKRLSEEAGLALHHSDDLMGLGWSEASAAFADLIERGPGIFEGVAAGRALRKLLARSTEKPCDVYVHLRTPHVALADGQAAMNKGVETVFAEIRPELEARGVRIDVYDVARPLP